TGVRTTNGGGQAKLVACINKRTGSFEDDRDLVVVAVNDIRGDKPISRAKNAATGSAKAPHARGQAPILKGSKRQGPGKGDCRGGWLMDTPISGFVRAGSLEELKAKGRLVVHGPHRPILVIHDKDRVFVLD